MFAQLTSVRCIAVFTLATLMAGGAYQQSAAVPPQNIPPVFTGLHSMKYGDTVYVWGWINDQDDPEEDISISITGDLTGSTTASSSGYFVVTIDATGVPLPIEMDVTATDPDDASATESTTISE